MKTTLTLGSLALMLGASSALGAADLDPALRTETASTNASSSPTTGIELPRRLIPASASMVAHVDLQHLKQTTLWRMFLEMHGGEDLEELREELGFNPFEVIRSATVYGTEGEPEVLVVVASSEIMNVFDKLEREGELTRLQVEGLSMFTIEEDVTGYISGSGSGDRILVMGEDAKAVIHGALVVRGEAPSLADSEDGSLRIDPVAGSFLLFAAQGMLPGMEDFEPASQVLGLAKGVQFDLGEAGGSLYGHLSLDTGSVETAQDVSDMVMGLLAMARLAVHANEEVPPQVQELIRALSVRSRNGHVSVDFEYSTSSLVRLLESLEESDF